MENAINDPQSEVNFDVHITDTKQVVARLIRIMTISVRKHKLDYGSVRYIHRQVLKRTRLSVPRKGRKLFELPSDSELEKFFAQINDPQMKLFFLLINHCGLRVSEACNLKVSKLDLQNQTIFITGKGDKDRIVVITKNLAEKIKMYLSGRKNIHLFESKLSMPFTTRRIEQLCKEYKEKAQITKALTPHTFRHWYFTKLSEQGVDADIRKMLAGHSSNKSQEIYNHVGLAGTKDYLLEVLDKMESLKILK